MPRVNFHTLPGQHSADEQAEGSALQNACQTLFATMGIKNGSLWQLVNILLPVARPLVSWLARNFPDARLKQALKVGSLGKTGGAKGAGAGTAGKQDGDCLTFPSALDTA